MKRNIWGIVIVVLIILIILGAGFLSNENSIKEGVVKIGFIGSLTGVDPNYGESMKKGLELAIEEINAKGPGDNVKIEVIYEDGDCIEGAKAASAAQKLISVDKVKIIIDGSCSTALLAYAPMAQEKGILVLSSGATADSVSNAGDYIFRNVPSSSIAGQILADLVSKEHKNAAILSENSDYANTLKNSFKKQYSAKNGKLLAEEQFQGDLKDYRTILLKIKNSNPEALIVNPQSADLVAQITKQAREIGINSQIYTAYFTSPNVVKAGSFMDGVKVIDLPDFNKEGTRAYDFFQKYKQRYGDYPPYQFSAVLSYDLGYLVAEAIENTSSSDPDIIKNYINDLKEFNGLAGKYNFDDNGDVVGINHSLKVIDKGNLSTLVEEIR